MTTATRGHFYLTTHSIHFIYSYMALVNNDEDDGIIMIKIAFGDDDDDKDDDDDDDI